MHIPPALYLEYASAPTHFMHLLVTDLANLFMYILELLSALLILYTTVVAFYKLFRHEPYAKVFLLHGQSIGLSFKLGAEILKTITAQNLTEIWEILLLIAIKGAMMVLIRWELRDVETPTSSSEGAVKYRKDLLSIRKSLQHLRKHPDQNEDITSSELESIRNDLNDLIEIKKEEEAKPKSKEPVL